MKGISMNIDDVKIGMHVKISNDPSYSIKKHGGLGGLKQLMAGSIQRIKDIYEPTKRIYIVPPKNCKKDRISFNICDIEEFDQSDIIVKKIEPVMFDPNQLDI
ncbi:MAG: hypothetical protein ACTSWK_00220 [Promethearchaeota archaeon]